MRQGPDVSISACLGSFEIQNQQNIQFNTMNKLHLRYHIQLRLYKLIGLWLAKAYLGCGAQTGLVHRWVEVVKKRLITRGGVDTIGWIKAIRLCYTRLLAGQPLTTSPGFDIKLDSRGYPEGVSLTPLFESRDSNLLRFGFTLLGVSRILPGWKRPDLTPIVTPGLPSNPDFRTEAVSITKELGWKIGRPVWEGCHVSTKAGPNAQAMLGSVEDASILTESQIDDLETIGGNELVRLIASIKRLSPLTWLQKFSLKPKGRSGRLSLIKDKEAKCRIVAILDYWTQSALKPLHDALMGFLKRLRPDCTFNQGSFRAKLAPNGPYYSFDLSNATDRFPVWLQEAILAVLVGSEEFAAAWRRLITDRDYHVSWANAVAKTVRYACGQPMGAYSSWAVFAVCHHVIVRVAAKRAGKPVSFSNYVLLGDDIVIGDHDVAAQYRAIMTELGVEISEQKTHVSNDTYEFAKRWIHNGEEVTGAPLGSFFECLRLAKVTDKDADLPSLIRHVSFFGLATWIREVEARWLPRSDSKVSRGLLANLFNLLGRGAQSGRLAEKTWRFFLLPSFEDGRAKRRWKTRELATILLADILTCNSGSDAINRVLVFLNECKARVLEEAIKRQMGKLQQFQLKLQSFIPLMPEELDAQSLLLSLPPIAAVRQSIAQLQLEFDKAHSVRESDNIAHWLWLDVRLFIDPEEVMSARKSKTAVVNKATIMNHLVAMCRAVAKMRQFAIAAPFPHSTDTDEQVGEKSIERLVAVINNYSALPRSGTRKGQPSRSSWATSVVRRDGKRL